MALIFPFPEPPAPGESLKVLPGIFWVRLPLPLKLDHVNVWVLDDGEGLTVVDTGLADEPTQTLLRRARAALPSRPIRRILVTHHHPDHCGLADRLCEEHGAELLMSSQAHEAALVLQRRERGTDAAATAARLAKHGLSPQAQQILVQDEPKFDKLKPGVPPDFTPLNDGDSVTIGDNSCQVIFGQGHAPDHVCLYSTGGAERGGPSPAGRIAETGAGGAVRLPHIRRYAASRHLDARGVAGHMGAGEPGGAVPEVGASTCRITGGHPRASVARDAVRGVAPAGGRTGSSPRAAMPDHCGGA